MTLTGWLQIAVLFVAVLAVTKPLGLYMARVFTGERTWLSPVLRSVEKAIYRASGMDETREQSWLTYAVSLLAFSLFGFWVRCIL